MKRPDNKHDKALRLLAILAACLAAAGCEFKLRSPSPAGPPAAAAPAEPERPAQTVFVAGGSGPFSMDSFKGRPLLVSVQGMGTPYLAGEMAALNRLGDEWGARGLTIVALLAGVVPEDDLPAAMASLAPRIPVAIGSPGLLKELGGVRALPTAVLVDASGAIRKRVPGPTRADELASDLEALIAAP